MVKQQNSNGFSPHSWYQSPLDRFVGHQAHRPAGRADWRIAAYHRNDSLALRLTQQGRRSRASLVVNSALPSPFSKAPDQVPDRLGCEPDALGYLRGRGSVGYLEQREYALYYPDLLEAARQNPFELALPLLGQGDAQCEA